MGLRTIYTSIYTGNTQLIHYTKEDSLGQINPYNDPYVSQERGRSGNIQGTIRVKMYENNTL
jgi:hypothetical protein